MKSRAIVTCATGNHEQLLDIAMPSFRAFAKQHGWTVLRADAPDSWRAPSWWKVPILREALTQYGEALWLDADTVIVDTSEDLEAPDGCWQALVEHHTGDGKVPNCGVWLVRRPMIPIFDLLWQRRQYLHHGWWEQAALMSMMGYRVEHPAGPAEPTELFGRTHFLDPGWNRHIWDIQDTGRVRIQHATMHPDRQAVMSDWARCDAHYDAVRCELGAHHDGAHRYAEEWELV